jgi:hypothetical protein
MCRVQTGGVQSSTTFQRACANPRTIRKKPMIDNRE